MKIQAIGLLLCITFLLSACGQSEEEKFYEKMNHDIEKSERNKQNDSCRRQNIIKKTNIDCDKEFPRMKN
ncbi:conjugal transfer protein TraH [Neisseria weixii]|uniref:conjugal transfer protein TraH n=1 Tax=Neisseria weixii TaxID=1853276 RepID=UPI000BB95EA5|nr:conjugal transfer protein TraH [Neisseria weixii]ATD64593.1 conjugal transfer protein TraH [Neisseria weixii]